MCVPASVYVSHVYTGALGEQKISSDVLKLATGRSELPALSAENFTRVCCRSIKSFNCWAISVAPRASFFSTAGDEIKCVLCERTKEWHIFYLLRLFSISGMRICVLSFLWSNSFGCERGERGVGGFLFSPFYHLCFLTESFNCKLSCLILYAIAMSPSLFTAGSSNEDSLSF